jgi:hypothetical protein
MPHFDISEYIEGFYQNLISLDNYTNMKKKFDPKSINNVIEAFDFDKSSYEVGEWVDVKDTINQWLEAQVMKVQNNKAYVHYNGWGTRWDEWIEFNSERMRNFKTYTLQSPITFCSMPYPAIPCDSNIEPQQRPIDIFFYLEKTKKHMENLLDEMNCLLNLRKKNSPLFYDNKFNMDNFEILFKATQMIPFLDRIGRMLSDISLVFSHFMVNPNYYSSFLFGCKRQDLFNEINNMKINKENKKDEDKFDILNEINKIEIKTKNEDSQTPPIESKFMKKFKEEQQLQTKKENIENKEINKPQILEEKNKNNENKIIINKNEENKDKEILKDKKENDKAEQKNIENKKMEIEDKKEIIQNKEQNEIIENKIDKEMDKEKEKEKDKEKEKEKEKEKKEEPKEEKNNNKTPNEIIRENINEETPQTLQRHHSVPSVTDSHEGENTANFQRQRQRQRHAEEDEDEILPNQIVTNLGYDLSFSSIELPFIQRIIYSYTISDRIISPFSPFYQIFSNKKLFPRVNLQVPVILSPGEVMMMTGYTPFSEPNFDVYIRTIAVNPNENNNNSNNNSNNNNSNNNNHT